MAAGIISARLAVAASGVGVGFAESLRTLTSARQAATGGVAIEDPWRSGSLLEATTVLLEPGDVRWGGLAYQSGFGEGVRLGAEGFIFGSAGSARSTENPDGTFGGEGGTASELQGGGRVAAIVEMARGEGWTVAGTGRLTGMIQRLPDERHGGLGLEAGAQARYALYEGAVLTAWGLAGPVGQGAGRGFADEVLAGAGVLAQRTTGLLGGAEGFGFGAEGAYLPKGLGQAGLGAVYWFGKPNGAGSTLFLRAGLRLAGEARRGSSRVAASGGFGGPAVGGDFSLTTPLFPSASWATITTPP
jgi:hypothetical protein